MLRRARAPIEASLAVLNHHERCDGKGYPAGCRAKGIPWAARVLTVADVYSALTADRPYRKRYSNEQALGMIEEQAQAFDPVVLSALAGIVKGTDEKSHS